MAIAPVPVLMARLDRHTRDPGACATVILDMFNVPPERRERLTPVGRVNAGQSLGALDEFLSLNRKHRKGEALKAAKLAVLNREVANAR